MIIPSKTSFSNNSKMAEQFLSSRCDELESEVQELREQVEECMEYIQQHMTNVTMACEFRGSTTTLVDVAPADTEYRVSH